MRHYRGFLADSARWQGFELRGDDVVITTPSKCGTTWMQTIVGMLLLDRTDLGAPLGTFSPWLDMQIRTVEEVHELLGAQTHRRWIKTHTPLDGLPWHPDVTYLAVIRHPLDAALSNMDHVDNADPAVVRLRLEAVGADDLDGVAPSEEPPEDPGAYLRWWIEREVEPTGSGPYSLGDFANYVRTYWERRHEPNVHLFHYADLIADRDGEMRRVAAALGVDVDEDRWADFVAAAGLEAMRGRASDFAPDAHLGIWQRDEDFFRVGGTRDWATLLTPADVEHFEELLDQRCDDAAGWVLHGRSAM